MRVIAGSLKGRRLEAPTWSGLRPTGDRVRETLFNVLADRPVEARVLDVCAGTGALGIEALSRGARDVVFVERDRRAVALIERNLARCAVTAGAHVLRGALPGAAGHPRLRGTFDLILVDPPYDDPSIDVILSAVTRRLAPGGRLVLERAKRRAQPCVPGLGPARTVMVGDTALDFFERFDPDPSGQGDERGRPD